jgi:hypothetical protein
MTARQVATIFLCTLLLAFLAACGGESSSTDDTALSNRGETAAEAENEAGTPSSFNYVARRDGSSAAADGSGLGEFEAAHPLGEEDMLPLASPGDRSVEKSTDDAKRETGWPDNTDAGELFAFEPAATEPGVRGTPAEIVGNLFRERAGADDSRTDLVIDDGDEFAAAPPVALADDVDSRRVE